MAKQQPSGEPKAPLIVALAFFVLASLVLGVLFYLETDKKATAVADAKKAADEKSNANKLLTDEQEKVRMYRTVVGVGTAEELASLGSSSGTKAKEEFDKLRNDLEGKMKGLIEAKASLLVGQNKALALKSTDIMEWSALSAGKADKAPERSMADAVVTALTYRLLAEGKQQTAEKAQEAATASFQTQAAAAVAEKKNLEQAIEVVKKEAKDSLDKQAAELAAIRGLFQKKTDDYVTAEKKMAEDNSRQGILLEESRGKVSGLEKRNERLEEKAEANEDPFRMQKPLGKIFRRERGNSNIVYIDLGSADNVTVGLRFTVQPANTPQVGVSGRLRPRLGPTGRPVIENGQQQYDMVPKGRIEVVEVQGENQSRCRITSETDPIRERIEYGDLLYNTSWRRGKTDTVALYGVFDANGDGADDIKTVISDLRRMNITVAAYFDLDKRQWLDPTTGRPTAVTEQVVYAIEGAYPISLGGDSLAGARSELVTALEAAKQQAKDRGIKLVKARTYFPQIGYEYRGADVPVDRINQAYNRYLRTAATGDAPPQAPEGKDGK